jgi:hypothetical protein
LMRDVVDWVEADLASWTPRAGGYELVACLYVHVAGSVEEMVRRMGSGVASGGTPLLVGHRPVDPVTGAATPAAGQVQVGLLCEPATVLLIMGVTGEQRN